MSSYAVNLNLDKEAAEAENDELLASAVVVDEFWEGVTHLPPLATLSDEQREHFNIEGGDLSQMLMVKLNPGEVITAEPGALVMMSDGIEPDTDIGDTSQGLTRCCCAGESLFRLVLKNPSREQLFIGLSPVGPGRIIPIDLRQYSGIRFSTGAFFAAYGKDWKISLSLARNAGTACCGGQGLFLNELHGNTTAFLTGIGTIEQIKLSPGQTIVVDQPNLLAFDKNVTFDVRSYCCTMVCCCGGFGIFQAVLTGPGMVLVHSLPMQKFRKALGPAGGNGGNNGNNNGGNNGNNY